MFINKSGIDLKTGIQKTSWASYNIISVSYTLYNWGEIKLNILLIYIINSVLIALVYKSLINNKGFKF